MKSKISKTCVFAVCIWVIVTLLRVAFHQPWFDEAHAYIIAKECSFLDIISLMNVEGHTFLWYLLLMPFAKLDLWYPYPMLIMNWIFCFIAILILWKKAPLHPVTKIFVTFSYPFLAQLPVVARCYAIGVMFLFILTAMYKNRLKSPLIFASCITLCANTSVMALFGAAAFGFIFAYDLIKGALDGTVSRKDFRLAFIIMAIGAVLILWQLGGSNSAFINEDNMFFIRLKAFLFDKNILLNIINALSVVSAAIILPLYCFKNKKVLFILLFPILAMLYTFIAMYGGGPHHYIFFYVYVLIALWLMKDIDNVSKSALLTEIIAAVLFFGQIFSHMSYKPGYFYSGSKVIVDYFITDEVANNGRIVIFKAFDMRFIPYLKNKNTEIYYYATAEKSDELTYDTPLLEVEKYYLSPSWIHRVSTKDKRLYALLEVTDLCPADGFIIEDRDYRMIFEPYKVLNKTYGLFKITEIKK